MAAIDDLNSRRFYHGTKADLHPVNSIVKLLDVKPVVVSRQR
jgi:hypothetical protein